ncbi:LysR family transcriptional regulator [Clostridium sp. AN503]|uniref:LysR family transcriptional regulator n=1 Tax=Clostridium sp. AN503 TaxID=3160598 RepID=UPI00345B2D06
MNTKQLSYIISIAEHGNLTAAAAELSVSQPALSKYLTELEEELGTDLFLRHKKRLYLTAAGKIYVESARRIISVKEQTYQMISALSGSYQKTITVGITPLRGAMAMARIFPHFHKRYPHINIALKEQYPAELRQSVLNRTVDLALRTCIDLEDPEVQFISAHEEDLVLFVPSFHPLASLAAPDLQNLTPVEIHRFQDTPFLIGKKGSTIRQLTDIIFQENQMQPTIVYESDNNLILKNMAQNGAGITLLPRFHMEPCSSVVYFRLKPNYSMHMAIMAPKNHVLTEEERYLAALNFASESSPSYRFNPCPLAKEIIDEFRISGLLY